MKLRQALRASGQATIAFAGAGGKTTALFRLAHELAPAIVTTTTHLGAWQAASAEMHVIWTSDMPLGDINSKIQTGVTLITGDLQGDRYRGLAAAQMEELRSVAAASFLPLLVEADGSRQKPLKAPAAHEPAIPEFADLVVVLAGLSGLGQPLDENAVHRAELFARLTHGKIGERITAAMVADMMVNLQGGLKGIPDRARRVAVLNQADTPELQAVAGGITGALMAAFDAVIVASLNRPPASPDITPSVCSVHEPVAGIVLAAGQSTRLGRPKQLLDYHGQAFVRRAAQTALQSGLSPVIVVTGAYAEPVEKELQNMPVVVIRNADWQEGQGSSIRAGVGALPKRAGGAIFLLADQPQVTTHVVRALIERHASTLAAIVAPLAAGRRANPVLFDRDTFSDLAAITGDVGGRAIFSQHQVDYITWHDESLLFDVDTDDDYQKLLNWGVKD